VYSFVSIQKLNNLGSVFLKSTVFMKTIIQVWTQECLNLEIGKDNLYWGFGDMIRSTIFLHQFCLKKGYNLIVDHQFHPVSEFLVDAEHQFSKLIQENRYNIPHVPRGKVIPFIESSKDEVIFLFATEFCLDIISQDTKSFMKSLLTPNATMRLLIDSYRQKLPTEYQVMHCRLGDSSMDKDLDGGEIQKSLRTVYRHADKNSLLVTDSKLLKEQVAVRGGFNSFDLKIGHLGYCNDRSTVQDTLVEFFLISGATKIKTYTVYPWISSFVYWVSKVYDIPLKSVFGCSLRLVFFRLFWNVQSKLHMLSISSKLK
jgi:hypothetical protein